MSDKAKFFRKIGIAYTFDVEHGPLPMPGQVYEVEKIAYGLGSVTPVRFLVYVQGPRVNALELINHWNRTAEWKYRLL